MTHEEFACWKLGLEYPVEKGKTGTDRLFETGWVRVVPYGSDALAANMVHGRTLSDAQLSSMIDLALEYHADRVYLDNGADLKVVWSNDSELVEKVAMRMTLAAISDRIVASEVTRILAAQIKAALYELRTAIAHALPERTWVPDGIKEISADRVDFRFKAMKGIRGDSDVSVGATVKYDAGSDTYVFTPFIVAGGMQFWGEPSSDFYVEDFGDVSKVGYIFEKAKRKLPAHIEL
jgi:hypothetical protein